MRHHLGSLAHWAQAWPKVTAAILGGISLFAFAPFFFWPCLFVSLCGLFWLIEDRRSSVRLFLIGWWFGLGHFTGGLFWLANAVKVAGMWYVMPLAAVGLPAGLAIFSGLATFGAARLSSSRVSRLWAFAFLWTFMEFARGHILTGFPWNLAGYIWSNGLLQSTSIIGIYGLTLLTVVVALIPFLRNWKCVVPFWAAFGGLWIWGEMRLQQAGPTQETGVNMRLVQGSIPQDVKWLADHFKDNLDRQMNISNLHGERPLKAVIWSESSVPTFVAEYPDLMRYMSQAVPPGGFLLFGSPRASEKTPPRWHTSVMVMNEEGEIKAFYDKSHLVPFGEYFPFRRWINLPKVTHGETDYTPGPGMSTVAVNGLPPFSPLICYEAIFPGEVVDRKYRPEWLLNLTNDAWYGRTPGPYQHLAIVRVRAIEEGLPLVRAANNGISAVYDAYGRLHSSLGLDAIGFIDFDLPKPLGWITVYSRLGDSLFWIMMLLLGGCWIITYHRGLNVSGKN
jgi:apolipoprotein N-acyltransferase